MSARPPAHRAAPGTHARPASSVARWVRMVVVCWALWTVAAALTFLRGPDVLSVVFAVVALAFAVAVVAALVPWLVEVGHALADRRRAR